MGGTIKNKNSPKIRNTTKKNKKQDIKLLSNNDLEKKHFKLFGYGDPPMRPKSMNKRAFMKLRGHMSK
jgi:hypothetical protein